MKPRSGRVLRLASPRSCSRADLMGTPRLPADERADAELELHVEMRMREYNARGTRHRQTALRPE